MMKQIFQTERMKLTISHAKTGIQFRSLLLDFSVEIPDRRHIVYCIEQKYNYNKY